MFQSGCSKVTADDRRQTDHAMHIHSQSRLQRQRFRLKRINSGMNKIIIFEIIRRK